MMEWLPCCKNENLRVSCKFIFIGQYLARSFKLWIDRPSIFVPFPDRNSFESNYLPTYNPIFL